MSMDNPILCVGFDKGEVDYALGARVTDLTFAQMQEFRAMIPVAIAQAEFMWRESHEPVAAQQEEAGG